MVGMEKVAGEFDKLLSRAVVEQRRKENGLPIESHSNHLIFTGGPGTGKTTVARELGKAYHALGIVPTDKFVSVGRGDLVGTYANNVASTAHQAFMKAKGGVLFVDEAYELAADEYGRQALTQLMADMENNRDDTVVILAGYPADMKRLVDTNPGLKSRLPKTINFPDYSPNAMRQILSGFLGKGKYVGARGTSAKLDEAITRLATSENHGNARGVRNLYDEIRTAQAMRVADAPDSELHRITPEDVDVAMAEMESSIPVKGKRRARLKGVAS